MKKIIPVLLVVSLAACGKKEWSKKYVYDDCMKEMGKSKEAAAVFSKDKMEKICDCSAGKTVEKFKSESDAKKDTDGLKEIGKECAMEVLAK
jgi:uncharacterized lipoprotein YehR (DUF1307 family)